MDANCLIYQILSSTMTIIVLLLYWCWYTSQAYIQAVSNVVVIYYTWTKLGMFCTTWQYNMLIGAFWYYSTCVCTSKGRLQTVFNYISQVNDWLTEKPFNHYHDYGLVHFEADAMMTLGSHEASTAALWPGEGGRGGGGYPGRSAGWSALLEEGNGCPPCWVTARLNRCELKDFTMNCKCKSGYLWPVLWLILPNIRRAK